MIVKEWVFCIGYLTSVAGAFISFTDGPEIGMWFMILGMTIQTNLCAYMYLNDKIKEKKKEETE